MAFGRIALAFALLVFASAEVRAMEPETIFARYSDYLSRMGLTARHGGVDVEGPNTFRFRDLDLRSGTDEKPFRVEWLRISDFAEDSQGGLMAGAIEAGTVTGEAESNEGKKIDIRIEGVKATGVYLPPKGEEGTPSVSKTTPFTLELGPISGSVDGVRAATINGMKASARYASDGRTIETETDLGRLDINTDQLEPDAKAQLQALGLPSLSFISRTRATWDPDNGNFDIADFRLEMPGAGALTLAVSLQGYTSELAKQMQILAQESQDQGNTNLEAQAAIAGDQMALMSAIKVASFSISLEDGSLTGKLLKKQAEAMGMTPEELIETVPALVQPYLAMTGDPAFGDQAASALQTFLKSPRNLAIAIAPAAPIAIKDLVGSALGDPASAIGLLGATVTANR
jgi:hypothetical protein